MCAGQHVSQRFHLIMGGKNVHKVADCCYIRESFAYQVSLKAFMAKACRLLLPVVENSNRY